MKDDLGTRMKEYEAKTKTRLEPKTYTLLRLDGKAFHTFTRGFKRPYDEDLMGCMDSAAVALCEEIEGAKFAFVQSDEIQILVTDFSNKNSQMWFDGEVQKIVSVSASIATAAFNKVMHAKKLADYVRDVEPISLGLTPREFEIQILKASQSIPSARFDSRVWQIEQKFEVFNAFLWRQQDATRNAISMTAQANFSHNQLQRKSSTEMVEMLLTEKGVCFNDQPAGFRYGRFVEKTNYITDVEYTDSRTGEKKVANGVTRSRWDVISPPSFSYAEGREWLFGKIPEPTNFVGTNFLSTECQVFTRNLS